jgi:GNAT superfamily N-acetyltransferase
MARRVRELTGEDVELLPGACSTCLFWELGADCPQPRTRAVPAGRPLVDRHPSDPAVRKQAWVSARVQEGFAPGRLVVIDGEVVAFAAFAPTVTYAPRGVGVPIASDDAVLLATAWVVPAHRGAGIGALLLRAALREAIRIDAPAVEVYGDRRFHDRSCTLPAGWLLHQGFEVHAEHPRTPLLRLDVRRTVRWAGSLEHAWEEVLGRLPHPVPALSPEHTSTAATGADRGQAGV